MKKKLSMRIASFALCLIFTCSLIAVPRARAALVEGAAVSIGSAVLASYMAASGLGFTVDSAETVITGLNSLVEDYVAENKAAENAEAWFSTIVGLVAIPGAGVLQLPASVVRIVGAFIDWFTATFDLTEEGSEGNLSFEKGFLLADETYLDCPNVNIDDIGGYANLLTACPDITLYAFPVDFDSTTGAYMHFSAPSLQGYVTLNSCTSTGSPSSTTLTGAFKHATYVCFIVNESASGKIRQVYFDSNRKYLDYSSFVTEPADWGVHSSGSELTVSRGAGFTDILKEKYTSEEDDRPLKIFLPEAITKPDDLANLIPELVADKALNPTYELVDNPAGDGTETDTPDDAVVVPGVTSWLQSILQGIKSIPDAIAKGIADIFTPSQEAVESLSAEVDLKLPFVGTLQGFGSSLVYNLEHPEACADGLGLTTVVDLGKGRGSYLGNTRHDLLDVSWYLEYKPLVDDIIVGFCWLCFLWNCYGALPRIIHGEGSIAGVVSMMQEDGSDDR